MLWKVPPRINAENTQDPPKLGVTVEGGGLSLEAGQCEAAARLAECDQGQKRNSDPVRTPGKETRTFIGDCSRAS